MKWKFSESTGTAWQCLVLTACLGCVFLLFSCTSLRAQPPEQEPQENEDEGGFSPLRAARDMKVGDYYFNKGKYDAAIKRYLDAALHRPNFAVPYLKIGSAYEKKKNYKSAIEAFGKYLEILPKGKDAAFAREQIEKLRAKESNVEKSEGRGKQSEEKPKT
jgi:tetratricopeptide (TPR) repeat protein